MFYQLKITRKGTKPPVWRRCTVAADVTFAKMAAMLEKLVQYPAGSLYEIEFFQKKVQIRENGDGEVKNNFTLLNAGETETAELMDSEKWFTFVNTKALFGNLFRDYGMLRIDGGIEGIGPLIHHVHERLLDKHRGHHAHAEFKKHHTAVHIGLEKVHIPFKFSHIVLTFEKFAAPNPWRHLSPAVRTTRYQVVGQGIAFYFIA